MTSRAKTKAEGADLAAGLKGEVNFPAGSDSGFLPPPGEPSYDPISEGYHGPAHVRIAGAGDVMLQHRLRIATDQRNLAEENNHGYDELFPNLSLALQDVDLAVANMEFPVFEKPMRGAPYVFYGTTPVITALQKAGFTVLTAANNHGYDQGRQSPASTARECKKTGMICLGVGETRAEAEAPYFVEINGMRLALIGYALLANANLNSNRDDAPRVNGYDFEPLKRQVAAAAQEADAVVVTVHWGVEYTTRPTSLQKHWARELAEAGAAVIFGHHPHVLEPLELITTVSGRAVLVAYSLGNFTTNQGGGSPVAVTRIGAIVKVSLARTEKGVEPVAWESLPTWVYNGSGRFQGRPVVDVHVEVCPLMIEALEAELAAPGERDRPEVERRLSFYRGRIAAAEKILETPRYPLP
jgi:poly-gamma-glutamate synthesis protein (capsule biosynthesis protein)